jgi:glycosyltransferase involved in cell wall biosynthesis
MRILSILPFSPPSSLCGGAENQMHSIHKGLLEQGIDIQVLASISQVGSSYQEYDKVPIWGINFPLLTCSMLHPLNVTSWLNWKRMLRFVDEKIPGINLIQVTPFREPAFWGHWLSRHLNVPWLARMAGSGSNGDFRYMSNFISRNFITRRSLPALRASCSSIIALDDETQKEAVANGFPKEKVVVISNSLVLNEMPALEVAQEVPTNGMCLFLGRIVRGKRVNDLIRAYSICGKEQFEMPTLWIVGGGDTDSVHAMVDSLNLQDTVTVCGHQKEVEDFLKKAIFMVNPSESEGFPNSILEGCAFGVPAILSDIPVHRRIAKGTGMEDFLFPVGDERLLAEKIVRFLSLNERDVIDKRIRSFQYAQGFSQKKRDEAYLSLYDRVMKCRGVENEPSMKGN